MHAGTGSYRHNNVSQRCVTELTSVIMQYDMMHEDPPKHHLEDT